MSGVVNPLYSEHYRSGGRYAGDSVLELEPAVLAYENDLEFGHSSHRMENFSVLIVCLTGWLAHLLLARWAIGYVVIGPRGASRLIEVANAVNSSFH
jgi:hypothetical protein